jgi:hypothetical protein
MRPVAAILIVVFLACPLLFASLIAIAVSTWTMDRNFYLSLLDDERLFQVPDAVSSAPWSEAVIEGSGGLQWKSVGRAAGAVLTPEYLRGQTARVVNQVFDYFDGRSGRFDISMDTTPVKKALQGDAGRKFARLLAEDLPVGGSAADFKLKPGRLPASRPASVSVDRAAAIILAGLPSFMSTIPDTVRLSDDPWAGSPRFPLFGALLAACIVLLVIAGGFWTAAAFVGGETRFERLQWFGWSLLAPAAGVLLMGLLVTLGSFTPLMRGAIESTQLQPLGFSASFISALIDAARHVLTRVGVGFLATGGIGAGISLGLLAWSWSIPREERKKAAAAQSEEQGRAPGA